MTALRDQDYFKEMLQNIQSGEQDNSVQLTRKVLAERLLAEIYKNELIVQNITLMAKEVEKLQDIISKLEK